jgi:tetratricopeptide (TPR) repeat protein
VLAHFNLGWALAQQQQWEGSLHEYNSAAKLPEALGGKALALAHLGKAPAAVKLLADAKKRYISRAWPCAALAAVYLDEGLTEKSVAELKQALAREPGDIESQKRLVQASLSMKNWQSAVQQCKASISKTPYDVDAYLDMARAQEQLKKNDDALSSLRLAMEVAPANALTHAAMSNVLERLGHASEAEDEARLALKLDPKQEIADSILQRLAPR